MRISINKHTFRKFRPVQVILVFIIIFTTLLLFSSCKASTSKGSVLKEPASNTILQNTDLLTIAGSGSNIIITQALLDAYGKKTGIRITIPNSIGTSGAIKALQADKLDIGLISRPLKDSEKEEGLKESKYARIGVVIGVHPGVPDESIQLEDLLNIYKGTKNTWSNGKTIIVLAREAGDSSTSILEVKIPGFKDILNEALEKKRWELLYSDQEANDAIKNIPNSIGLSDTTALVKYEQSIKPLKLNGVFPSVENINNQTYPLYKDLFFAYKEPLSDASKKFLEYAFSKEGQKVLSDYGSVPLKGD